jgi:Peptidase family M28
VGSTPTRRISIEAPPAFSHGRDNPPLVDAAARIEVIRELCSFKNRAPGTDAERRAANWLAARLRSGGRRAEVEPTYVHPRYGLVHAGHCALGLAGSLLATLEPAIGFAIVLGTAVSMYLDLNYRVYLLRHLFFRRASQNVVAPGNRPDAPARLFLCAHYDAARTGAAFNPRLVARGTRLGARLPVPIGPFRILFWSLALLLPIIGVRMAGIDSALISILQLPPTLALMVGAFLLIDIELSEVVPGANDNGSGVATVLSLAEQLDTEPPANLDVWVLLTGGEECLQEGMRSFIRAHRADLDRGTTYFVNVDTVGHGTVRFETGAGWVVTYPLDRRLVELCAAIATADRESSDRYRALPLVHGLAGDSMPPSIAGLPATAITCLGDQDDVPGRHTPNDTPDRIDPAALDRAHGFALELVRALDRDVGRRTSR